MRACLTPLFLWLVTGCMLTQGEPTLKAELERARAAGAFAVVEASPTRAIIAARGRQIVVSPSEGSCINEDAIDLSASSAFLLLTDCTLELGAKNGQAVRSRSGERLHMADGFPGLVTVSVAGEARGTLQSLEAFLVSPGGRDRLARGARGTPVEVVEMRELGDGLFVHARALDDSLPILSRDFWRAFVEVNGRLIVVTVSGFRANTIASDEMLAHVLKQIDALERGNRGTNALTPTPPPVAGLGTVRAVTAAEPQEATPTVGSAAASNGSPGPKTARPPSRPAGTAPVADTSLTVRSPGPNDPLPTPRPGRRAGGTSGGAAPVAVPAARPRRSGG
ncbi:MAG: hypothetical protein AAF565_04520 [Pseudomonadota bacterium]